MQQLTRAGVTLCYEEAGHGAPPILFLHGGLCDHTHFAPQFAYYRQDHRVVAPDLRGHGQSDKPEQVYSVESLSEDVAWLCTELGLNKPVVVGHSLGGVVALDLAARHPDLTAAIVMLDAPILVPPSVAEAMNMAGFLAALHSPAYRDVVRGFIGSTILPTDDQARSARILDQMSSAPHYVVSSAFEQAFSYDAASALAALTVPTMYVRSSVPTDLDRLHQINPHALIGQTVGSGHFHQLEVPEQINAMIDRFLMVSLSQAATQVLSSVPG